MLRLKLDKLGKQRSQYTDLMAEWKTMTPEQRAKRRDEINTTSLFSRCEELTGNDLECEDKIDVGDFFIGRTIWDDEKEKYHDHSGFVLDR